MLDVKLPAMDGFSLYKKIKKIDDKVRICFLTAANSYIISSNPCVYSNRYVLVNSLGTPGNTCIPVIVASDCLASEIASFIPLIEFADRSRATRNLLNLFFNIYV
jgi:hypothetical protein